MKVNVRRVQSGVAVASTLLAATGVGTLGCAGESESTEESNLDAVAANPGSGQIQLQFGGSGTLTPTLINSTTDEFVRVGESLKVVVPVWVLWEQLYPNDAMPGDDARLKKLKATVKLTYLDKTTTISTKTLTTTSWTGTSYSLEAVTGSGTVPKKTDSIQISITIKDSANTAVSATVAATQIGTVPVFGGDLPNKTLLFDNTVSAKRERVIDGDLPVKGSNLTIGFSDWRADQVVDKTTLNTQIGVASFGGRFGTYDAPIYGTLTYDVSVGYSLDGGKTWTELVLPANTASRILGSGRTDYEANLALPKTASQLLLYGHVKATLTADYSKYSNVKQKYYSDGQQVMIKEAWDNPTGANSNYTIPLQ
jgi:hypothetical protein